MSTQEGSQRSRIQITDSTQSAIMKMCEGNPGALTVCVQILKEAERIDPDAIMGGIGAILSLDTLGLYGSRIWMLYKDVCEEDIPTMLAVLRGWQMGLITDAQVRSAVESYGNGVNIQEVCAKVAERLPRFQLSIRAKANRI